MEAIKTSVTNVPAEVEVKGKAVKKSGKRIGYNYIILKSLKESQKNDVVKCLYIKSLTNWGICVIKEGTYGDTKDKHGRDIKDRLMWQRELHEKLQGKVKLPRLLGSFEENGNYYLVLERISGKSLYRAIGDNKKTLREGLMTGNKLGKQFLDYLIQLVSLLERLHHYQVIHRDVTANNFMITPSGKLAVIDMELSYSLDRQFPDPPFQLGTHGYMSPQQEATLQPTFDQDTFSAAAIILQVWTCISPSKIVGASFEDLIGKVRFFITDKILADIITAILNPEPEQRPSLAVLKEALVAYRNSFKTKTKRAKNSLIEYSEPAILDNLQQAIHTVSSPLLADKDKGWFSENTSNPVNNDKKKINKGWYASFHKGGAGVIYMLGKAHSVGLDVSAAAPHIEKALALVEAKYINASTEPHPGLHFGSSGIAAVLAGSMREGLIEPKIEYFNWINKLLDLDNTVLGFQSGIAGQGMANWICQSFLQKEKLAGRLNGYVNRIIAAQEKDGSWIRLPMEKKVRVTKGFAHGVAGISYFLLEFGNREGHQHALASAELGLQFLMKTAIHEKGYVKWRSSGNKEISPWWCEGGAGIALAFMKGYSKTGNQKYKDYASAALRIHHKNCIDNNLSQCHGMAGLGEIYLEAFKILQDEEWLDRAKWIVHVLMNLQKKSNTHDPYWIVENERHPVPNFMTGNSGIIHFLLRYCHPGKIVLPLMQ